MSASIGSSCLGNLIATSVRVAACALAFCSLPTIAAPTDSPSRSPAATAQSVATISVRINPDHVLRSELPSTFFGFNVRWTQFEKDLWDQRTQQTKPQVIEALKPLSGALYRYPGGLVANEFIWEDSTAPIAERIKVNAARGQQDALPLLGVDEFTTFLHKVDGTLFYTLNLVGKGNPANIVEFPADQMAESNRKLAGKLKSLMPSQQIHYYELGNELDRNRYEWPAEKYVARSLASIKAIQTVDPDARFVAFLRDFNWRYKNGDKGISRYQDLFKGVLGGLPMVNDYSLHMYYDGELRPGGNFLDIETVVKRIDTTLKIARIQRPGKDIGIWITEHSRRLIVDNENSEYAKRLTGGLGGALSTADFLIAMAQIPEVRGTALQALNGVGRQVFDVDRERHPKPLPIYWSLRLLDERRDGKVLETVATGPSRSGYQGGYDVRATAFATNDDTLNVWIVNRAESDTPVDIDYAPFSNRRVSVTHRFMAGKPNQSPDTGEDEPTISLDAPPQSARFGEDGKIRVILPPSSVSTFTFSRI